MAGFSAGDFKGPEVSCTELSHGSREKSASKFLMQLVILVPQSWETCWLQEGVALSPGSYLKSLTCSALSLSSTARASHTFSSFDSLPCLLWPAGGRNPTFKKFPWLGQVHRESLCCNLTLVVYRLNFQGCFCLVGCLFLISGLFLIWEGIFLGW